MYKRDLTATIREKLGKGKVIVILGPRQVGKTTLVMELLSSSEYLFLNCDDPVVSARLTNANTEQLRSIIGKENIVFIDEAQRIANIGLTLKLVADQFKDVQLIVSGSSSFELANAVNEPLTGRKWEYYLFPVSFKEIEETEGYIKAMQKLSIRLVYGSYPDVLNEAGNESEVLTQLVNSYLYRDILSYGGIRKPQVLEKLVQALAFQTGSEVSYNELATLVGTDKNTVSSYISVLEKAFVIFRLTCFSRNLRNEIKNNQKIYFYDVGVRNTVIGNYQPMELRDDKGALWENFLITERLKKNTYFRSLSKPYFWRTKQQQEIDYVEVKDGVISGYEFKWNPAAKSKIPRVFKETYQAEVKIVHPENFRDFVI